MGDADPLDLVEAADPVAGFAAAVESGRLIGVRSSGTVSARLLLRTPASWTDSFPRVSELAALDATSRVWIPGPTTSTMNLFHRIHAAWAGARSVDTLGEPAGATHAVVTPAVLARLVSDEAARLTGVGFIVAGDHLDPSLADRAEARGGVVHHYYGAAELSFVAWGRDAATLRPFPGVEVELRDDVWWVRSPYLAEGVDTDARGFATVGDRGAWVGDTVRVHGRPGAITTGGVTVVLSEVERVLRAATESTLIVVGLPHPDLGSVIACAADRPEALERARVAAARLAPPERPRRWLLVDTWPLTGAGKLDRAAVAAALIASRASDHIGAAP